jgi:hypothetical protein
MAIHLVFFGSIRNFMPYIYSSRIGQRFVSYSFLEITQVAHIHANKNPQFANELFPDMLTKHGRGVCVKVKSSTNFK